MDLSQLREQINAIDARLRRDFLERMDTAQQIARYKQQNGLPVLDSQRERQVINRVTEGLDEDMALYMRTLYTTLMALSRSYQNRVLNRDSALRQTLDRALAATPSQFPSRARVACQGTEGAYSHGACEKLFAQPEIVFYPRFEDVFQAVDRGECAYGVLPIENSSYGSVVEVYDLMRTYRFSVVRRVRTRIDHQLLVNPGTRLEDVREILSHPQALGQCGKFLHAMPVQVTPCVNTAVAALTVAQSGRKDLAAISSPACAQLYGLANLHVRCADSDNNYTRFICVSKDLQIFPGADHMSLIACVPHKPGALYRLMAKISALGINLTKLESRPIPGSDFEFLFYFDLEASVYSDKARQLLDEMESSGELYHYLGSYSEVS